MRNLYKFLALLFFLMTILLLYLYISKPQLVTKTIKDPHPCNDVDTMAALLICEASESCRKEGGRLKHFRINTKGIINTNTPEFECDYENISD